jgi:hypothetical protein
MLFLLAAATALTWTHLPACGGYVVQQTTQERAADAELVSHAYRATLPDQIGVVMAGGGWRIVWATPVEQEPGIFFFHGLPSDLKLVDIWGGPTQDRDEAANWAMHLGAPAAMAQCFATRLVQNGP